MEEEYEEMREDSDASLLDKAELEKLFAASQRHNEKLSNQVRELQKRLRTHESQAKSLVDEAVGKQLDTYRDEIAGLRAREASLEDKKAECSDLLQRLDSQSAELNDLRAKLRWHVENQRFLEEQAEELEELRGKDRSRESTHLASLEALNGECSVLRKRLEAQSSELEEMRGKVRWYVENQRFLEAQSAELEDLRAKVSWFVENQRFLEEKVADLEEIRGKARSRESTQLASMESMKGECSVLRRRMEAQSAELEEMKGKIKWYTENQRFLEEQTADLERMRGKARSRESTQLASIDAMKWEHSLMRQRVEAQSVELDELRAKIRFQSESARILEEKDRVIEEQRAKMDAMEEEIKSTGRVSLDPDKLHTPHQRIEFLRVVAEQMQAIEDRTRLRETENRAAVAATQRAAQKQIDLERERMRQALVAKDNMIRGMRTELDGLFDDLQRLRLMSAPSGLNT